MHHCLYISEVLGHIFDFVRHWDRQPYQGTRAGKRTLAALARTCHAFSSLALDALWHDIYGFDPLLKVLPIQATSSVDDPQWINFREYAKRVKTFRGRSAGVPQVKEKLIAALQQCPKACLPLLSNVVELEWDELSYISLGESDISLLRFLVGPAVTTVTLSLMRWQGSSSTDLSLLADLPKLYPNLSCFTFVPHWVCDASLEVGQMVTQWSRLRTLRTCGVAQPVMDQLFTSRALESLYIDYHESSPVYSGEIPVALRELTLSADRPSLCTRFFKTAHASPTKARLLIGMNDRQGESDLEETFSLLPLRLDTSRLLSLTIQPRSSIFGIPMWHTPSLRQPLLSALVKFRALHELDLDLLCTAQISDADYECLAESMMHLRALKLGTANPSITRPRLLAGIAAVVAILRHCQNLDTLHILFDSSIRFQAGLSAQDSNKALLEEPGSQWWGACNRSITKLRVGYSPIRDATINAVASCFKSIMPCLVQIERNDRDDEWRLVENMLAA